MEWLFVYICCNVSDKPFITVNLALIFFFYFTSNTPFQDLLLYRNNQLHHANCNTAARLAIALPILLFFSPYIIHSELTRC